MAGSESSTGTLSLVSDLAPANVAFSSGVCDASTRCTCASSCRGRGWCQSSVRTVRQLTPRHAAVPARAPTCSRVAASRRPCVRVGCSAPPRPRVAGTWVHTGALRNTLTKRGAFLKFRYRRSIQASCSQKPVPEILETKQLCVVCSFFGAMYLKIWCYALFRE